MTCQGARGSAPPLLNCDGMPQRNVTALETTFGGVTFRSRTEARWAVFFRALDLEYRYEPERLNLSSGDTYLPDFFLPDLSAYFEVKPHSDAIVTVESVKARTLAEDRPKQRVWLAVGAPDEKRANVIPLNQWPLETDIEHILSVAENRYRFMEDRRDDQIFWLHSEFVGGQFHRSYMVGGKGRSTDHDRLPMINGRILEAYRAARTAFAGKKP
jgi:hypothetical protein